MKAVVTGGTGFIGGRLVEALVKNGHQVRCLVRETSDVNHLNKLGVELFQGDLGDVRSLEKLPEGADMVFHLAAHVSDWGTEEEVYNYNFKATEILLNAAQKAGVKRFLHMSSSTVVWKSTFWDIHNLVDIDEEFPYREKYNDYYNASKADAEKLVLNSYTLNGFETVVFRPSNVWGAGDTVILPRVAMAAVKGILYPMGSGERTVTPCHVDNLVNAMLLAVESEKAPGNIYFVNDGRKIEYMEFMTKQLHASGIDWKPKRTIPYKPAYAIAAVLEAVFKLVRSKKPPVLTRFAVAALAGSRSYSIEKARKQLGYEPSVDLDEGMAELEKWVKSIGGTESLIAYV